MAVVLKTTVSGDRHPGFESLALRLTCRLSPGPVVRPGPLCSDKPKTAGKFLSVTPGRLGARVGASAYQDDPPRTPRRRSGPDVVSGTERPGRLPRSRVPRSRPPRPFGRRWGDRRGDVANGGGSGWLALLSDWVARRYPFCHWSEVACPERRLFSSSGCASVPPRPGSAVTTTTT